MSEKQKPSIFARDGIRPGVFYYGDNLEGMQKMPDECIDMIYLDPPFNSKKQWSGVVEWRDKMTTVAFKDAWNLNDIKQVWFDLIQSKEAYQPLREVAEAVRITAGENAYAYILYMAIRLIEMKRILKSAGSIFYHCDPVMAHSVKLMMDSVFGAENFRNEIIWSYGGRGGKAVSKQFPRNHDVIMMYAKSDAFDYRRILTVEKIPLADARKYGILRDEQGRWFHHAPRGHYTDESIAKLKKEGRIFVNSKGTIRIKYFHRADNGFIYKENMVGDVWGDIPDGMHLPKGEKTGYPTQKPEKLLERIILASTEEGDVVLDPFAGSGTTCAVAEKLNRRRIGMDLNREAADISTNRLRAVIKSLSKGEQKERQSFFCKGGKNAIGVRRQTAAKSIEYAKDLRNIIDKNEEEVRMAHRKKLKEDALQVQHGICLGCGRWSFDGANFDCEHIYPKSRGGLLTKNNTQALCGNCNRIKGNGTMRELWRRLENKERRWTGEFWRLVLRTGKAKNYTKEDLTDAQKRCTKADNF